jgi:hypothetical protein
VVRHVGVLLLLLPSTAPLVRRKTASTATANYGVRAVVRQTVQTMKSLM